MDIKRPLGTALFFYEIFRLLLLVVFLFIIPSGSYDNGTFHPYIAFMSANALFPLITLFVLLKPEEYGNFLTLYMAGKIIGAVSFYSWEFLSFPRGTWGMPGLGAEISTIENIVKSLVVFGGSMFVSLADIFSVWGAWTLKNKYRQTLVRGGV